MTRLDIAYLLVALLVGAVIVVVILSRRFSRYQRAVRHGQRDAPPVWHPFWMP
jgi:hypothetical protein